MLPLYHAHVVYIYIIDTYTQTHSDWTDRERERESERDVEITESVLNNKTSGSGPIEAGLRSEGGACSVVLQPG